MQKSFDLEIALSILMRQRARHARRILSGAMEILISSPSLTTATRCAVLNAVFICRIELAVQAMQQGLFAIDRYTQSDRLSIRLGGAHVRPTFTHGHVSVLFKIWAAKRLVSRRANLIVRDLHDRNKRYGGTAFVP
jgi:hypothetical protein